MDTYEEIKFKVGRPIEGDKKQKGNKNCDR